MSPLEVQLRAQVVAQAMALAEREQRLATLAERIAQLEHQVRLLQRALSGPKSERLMDRGQQLELEELLAQLTSELAEATPPPPLPEPRETRRSLTPHGRALIPDHLPRVEVLIDLPEQVCRWGIGERARLAGLPPTTSRSSSARNTRALTPEAGGHRPAAARAAAAL
jgi:hypothetical protein